MEIKSLGSLIKKIRTISGLTLEELSLNICSVRQLSRIEAGVCNPSAFVLASFSKRLGVNLGEYYRLYFLNNKSTACKEMNTILHHIKNNEYVILNDFIKQIEKIPIFQYGENLQYLLYSKALYQKYIHNDYTKSIDLCTEIVKCEDLNFDLNLIGDKCYSNISLASLNLIASNYFSLKDFEKSYSITKQSFIDVEKYIYDYKQYSELISNFKKDMFKILSCNLSILELNKNNIEESYNCILKGLNFCIDFNNYRFFTEMLNQKINVLKRLKYISETEIEVAEKEYEVFYKLFKKSKKQYNPFFNLLKPSYP